MTKLRAIVHEKILKILTDNLNNKTEKPNAAASTGNVDLESDAIESAFGEAISDWIQNVPKTLPSDELQLSARAPALWKNTLQVDDPENDVSEVDDSEIDDPENDASEVDDPENDVSEVDDSEIDDPENDASEVDDPENDVPEVDDPEVAAAVSKSVVCSLLPQNPFELRWNDDEGSVYTLETLSNGNVAYTIRDKTGDLKTLMIYNAEGTMITEIRPKDLP